MKALKSLGRFGLFAIVIVLFGAFAMLTALWSWWMALPSVTFGILAVMGVYDLIDPRAHDLCLFGGDGRHVQGVCDGTGQQVVGHLFSDLKCHVFLCFRRGGPKVGGADDVGEAEQRVFGRGLFLEHVEGCASDMAGFQRFGQCFFVDQTAAGTVDDRSCPAPLSSTCRNLAGASGWKRWGWRSTRSVPLTARKPRCRDFIPARGTSRRGS